MKTLILSLILLVFSGLIEAQNKTALTKVSFVPHWLPQAQFAGYYAAYEKGIYKKHGIDLQILTGGPANPSSELIKSDKVDFALLWLTNAIQLKEQGSKIVNIAQMVQKSALMLVTKQSSGINTPKDMEGKKVGLWGGDFTIQPMSFFKKYNVNVKPIQQGSSINLFLMDGVDVTTAMWYNEYHTIQNAGYDPDELNMFFFSDVGLNFPEDGIYCSEKTYNEKPELCRAFIKATLEGWMYAFEHPQEAIKIVIKYMKDAKVAANKAHQKWMLNRMKDIFYFKNNSIDITLRKKDYIFVSGKLKDYGSIKVMPEYNTFYKSVSTKVAQ